WSMWVSMLKYFIYVTLEDVEYGTAVSVCLSIAHSSKGKAALARRVWQLMFECLMRTAPDRGRGLGRRGLTPNDSRALASLRPREGRTMRSLAEEWECDASNA